MNNNNIKTGSPITRRVIALSVAFLLLQPFYITCALANSQNTIRIATFNIKDFGQKKSKKPKVMETLAKIVRKYDIVAIQEISDIKEKVPNLFLTEINNTGSAYEYKLSDRSGKQDCESRCQEQYAFYYDTNTIKALDDGELYDDSAKNLFKREPFVAQFSTQNGNFNFVLINIHITPDDKGDITIEEIMSLSSVITWAQETYSAEDDFIVLGDFNAGCDYATDGELDKLALFSEEKYFSIVPHKADTTFSYTTCCAYDRIVATIGLKKSYTKNWGVDLDFGSDKVSDHRPVWAEFKID